MAFNKNHTADVRDIFLDVSEAADKVCHDCVSFEVGLSISKKCVLLASMKSL